MAAERRPVAHSPEVPAGREAPGLDDHISVRIVRLSEALTRIASQTIETRWGLRNTDLRILNTLDGQAKGLPISEIARRVHVDKGWVSRSVQDLARRELLETRQDPADPRRRLAVLSQHGRARVEEVRPEALRHEIALLGGIDSHALKTMLDHLEHNATQILEGLA